MIMKEIRRILCCCGNGIGSSLILELNVNNILDSMNKKGVNVSHDMISVIQPFQADLLIVGTDLRYQVRDFSKVIIIHDFLSEEELRCKLKKAFESKEDKFIIE